MDTILAFFKKYNSWLELPDIGIIDIIEIFIIAFAIYHIIMWVRKTRAWMLVKGLIVLLVVCLVAIILHMNVVLWIFEKTVGVGITALNIVFQPELRNALEQLGRRRIFSSLVVFEDSKSKSDKFSDKTINEIVRATYELAKTKTGALIVLGNEVSLGEYERTGIVLDSVVSSQLLVNIFEHNTPLHDGAIIIQKDRIVAATCYLPLSDNMELSKDLGTRHRAGVGISEVTDSLTIIVSEETGKVSIAHMGTLVRSVDGEYLKAKIENFTGAPKIDTKRFRVPRIWNHKK